MTDLTHAARAMSYARRIREWRFVIILAWAIVIVQGLQMSGDIAYDPDVLVYFDPAGEARQEFEAVQERFGRTNEVVTLVVPHEGSVFAPEPLRAVARLAVRSELRPEVIAVRTILSNLETTPAAVLKMGDRALSAYAADLADAVSRTTEDNSPLIPDDNSLTAVAAILASPDDNAAVQALADAHRNLKEDVAALSPGVTLMQTGRLVIDDAFLTEGRDDVDNFAGPQVALLLAVLFLALGSMSMVIVMTVMVFCAIGPLLGFLGLTGFAINGISSAAPAVLMGLVVASAIHIVMAWQDAIRGGADRLTAVAVAYDRNARPVAISIATTAISFLLLNLAEAPPFRQLGNLTALGLVILLAALFTLLPALLLSIPKSRAQHRLVFERWMAKIGRSTVARRWPLLALTVVVAVTAGWSASTITVDDTFSHYFDEQYEVRRATDLFEERLSGTTIVDIAVDLGRLGGAVEPATLERLAALRSWLLAQPEVARVNDPSLLAERAGDAPLSVAHDRAVESGLPPLLSEDARHARLSIVMRGVSSRDTIAFAERAQTEAQQRFAGSDVLVTGMPILSARLSVKSTKAMFVAMALALGLISILIMTVLRSVRLGLVSLLPNLLPVLIAFGLWGVLAGEVSFAATVVGALTYGLVVDDTVHILSKYQRFRRRYPVSEAMAAAFGTVGVAVVVTSVALALSFLPFATSGFLVNQHFGALTALTLCAALVADLVLLPAILAVVDRRRREPSGPGRRMAHAD